MRVIMAMWVLVFAALPMGRSAHAAGGHFAVEDAFIAEPDHCDLETWREMSNGHNSSHSGIGCQWQGVEPGLNLDLGRQRGAQRTLALAPQIKAIHAFNDQFHLGLLWLSSVGQEQPGAPWHWQGHLLLIPMTWLPREDLQLHLNLGRDFVRAAPDTTRRGASLEWHPAEPWTTIAEYFHDGEQAFHRLGARWQLMDCCSLDLSRTQPQHRPDAGWWTVGWNWSFSH